MCVGCNSLREHCCWNVSFWEDRNGDQFTQTKRIENPQKFREMIRHSGMLIFNTVIKNICVYLCLFDAVCYLCFHMQFHSVFLRDYRSAVCFPQDFNPRITTPRTGSKVFEKDLTQTVRCFFTLSSMKNSISTTSWLLIWGYQVHDLNDAMQCSLLSRCFKNLHHTFIPFKTSNLSFKHQVFLNMQHSCCSTKLHVMMPGASFPKTLYFTSQKGFCTFCHNSKAFPYSFVFVESITLFSWCAE